MTKEEAIKKFFEWKNIPLDSVKLIKDDIHTYEREDNHYYILSGVEPLTAIAESSSEFVILYCPDRYLINKETGEITESPILVA